MSTVAEQPSTLIGAYLARGTVGNVGTPGAPIMHYSLVVVPSTGSVSGTVEITQAIAPPQNRVVIPNVHGVIRKTGLGPVTQIVALQGQYVYSVPPPAIGSFLADFSAHLAIDNAWNGRGGFSYFNHNVENVPVTPAN
ncbi:MAG: DUF1842 domain-containing protein [Opitutae bacterium]|nr:DUF1842 domain-containing protein [Opitutae bacterium]